MIKKSSIKKSAATKKISPKAIEYMRSLILEGAKIRETDGPKFYSQNYGNYCGR